MRKAKTKEEIYFFLIQSSTTLGNQVCELSNGRWKKSIAYNIFYDAVGKVESKVGENGLEVWKKALNNIAPSVEVKSRRVWWC